MYLTDQTKQRYDLRIQQNKAQFQLLVEKINTELPIIAKLNEEKTELWLKCLQNEIDMADCVKKTDALQKKIDKALAQKGYDKDVLTYQPLCKKCADKGTHEGSYCECISQMIIDDACKESGLLYTMAKESFETYDETLFSDKLLPNGKTERSRMMEIRETALRFVEEFDSSNENLLFIGGTGTGKTYLSNCIAREILHSGKSVVYISAYNLIEMMTDISFSRDKRGKASMIFKCDLLIIDDFGCERQTEFSEMQLLNILNERLLNNKNMIISTNLTAKTMQDRYTNRIVSRLTGNFRGIRFISDDLRSKVKARRG